MSESLERTDPGPMARFLALTADPGFPAVLVQRLAGGETLREVAKSLGLPRTRLFAWVAANSDLSAECERALRLAGVDMVGEAIEILDEATPESIEVDRERAKIRERVAGKVNRPLFGNVTQHRHEHVVDLGERLRRAKARVLDAPTAAAAGEVVEGELI